MSKYLFFILLSVVTLCMADNSVYIEQTQASSNNTVSVTQNGGKNTLGGIGGSESYILNGSNNTVTVRQGDSITNLTNTLGLGLYGSNNTLEINQARIIDTGLADGYDSNGHTANIKIVGNSNIFKTQQTNTTVGPHIMSVDLTGNNDTVTLRQISDNTKQMAVNILGSGGYVNVLQGDAGNHILSLTLNGNGHSVDILQRQDGSHNATINLTNAGGSSNLTLIQQGNTGQSFSISQQCANLSGCSVSVTQGQ
jgi:hypothetical protein